jgi:hypothetical protein
VNKSSQADRCHLTGQTPGRAPWQAFALIFIVAIFLMKHKCQQISFGRNQVKLVDGAQAGA